ncbi:MAG: MBL fold metallo-hydrolase [bacterium]
MRLHFLGGTRIASGNSYLLEVNDKKILIDCGMYQGNKKLENKNFGPFDFAPQEIDFVIVTHSHLDHIGRLPMLIKEGFRGKIFATPPTIEFTRVMLEDTRRVLQEKAQKAGRLPLFAEKEIDEMMNFFEAIEYHEKKELAPGISFEFFEAGHILGSAFVKLEVKSLPRGSETTLRDEKLKVGRTIVFSGDLGNTPVPILRPLETIQEADYVLVESVYGDRLHETNKEAKETVEDAVEDAISKKGVLMIPSFAMERAQQLLYHLNELVENKRIPAVPIFFDSPLAIRITKIYEKFPQYFNKEAQGLIKSGDDIFKFPGLRITSSVKESKGINDIPAPKIIIAGSGMSQGGRILHHEARYLPDAKNTLLMVTYQAAGTLGRQILEGENEVEILDQKIPVRAAIKSISGYSAHADQKGLVEWLEAIRKPIKKIFVVQGEEKPALALVQIIKDRMGIVAEAPEMGDVVELE